MAFYVDSLGPLMGGPQCCLSILRKVPCPLSILRKVNVPCHYFLFLSVDFKRVQCRLSNLRKCRVTLSNLRVKGHAYTWKSKLVCGTPLAVPIHTPQLCLWTYSSLCVCITTSLRVGSPLRDPIRFTLKRGP